MPFSYSKVECFDSCPYKYKLRYIDKLKTIPKTDPDCALYLGTACHEGIEHRSIDKAIESYKSHYSEITDDHELEMSKLKSVLPMAIEQIPEGEYEHRLSASDGFTGFIDCLVPNKDGTYNILDFKFSNNTDKYAKSSQIHVYKSYYEQLTGNKVKDLYYVCIPKSKVKLTEGLSLEEAKKQIEDELSKSELTFIKVDYDENKVKLFQLKKTLMQKAMTFEKNKNRLCDWCDYKKYCQSNGRDTSELVKEPVITEVNLFG